MPKRKDGCIMMKKTKSEIICEMLANVVVKENAEWVNFLTNEAKLLEKKKASKKPTPKQTENEEIKNAILCVLSDGNFRTVKEVRERLEADISSQKATALIRQLVETGKVTRFEEKRVAYFRIK